MSDKSGNCFNVGPGPTKAEYPLAGLPWYINPPNQVCWWCVNVAASCSCNQSVSVTSQTESKWQHSRLYSARPSPTSILNKPCSESTEEEKIVEGRNVYFLPVDMIRDVFWVRPPSETTTT